ncbi:transglutaminase TgpA family protein [Arenimonas sp.]|uniref:transglutaminase TgpA family protein n=1 Tax=Arenimonas sp. TaxID=1872635 RepID=UPI0039E54663
MTEALPTALRRFALLAATACALPLLILQPVWLALVLLATSALSLWGEKAWPGWLRMLLVLTIGGLVMAAYGFRVGRDTASAGLLAMLMLKSYETYSVRDARSLLGFSLFAPFAAFLQDQGPITLGLALPALLLSTMAWAALLQGSASHSWSMVWRAARALAMALPLALAGFWLFPRLAAPMWGLPDNAIAQMGLGDRMTPFDWQDVLVDDSAAMRVRFFGATPGREQMYWRGPVLTRFDGEAWERDDSAALKPAPHVQARGQTISYEVMLEPTSRRDLPVLELPLDAPAESRINSELTAIHSAPVENLIRYEGHSAPNSVIVAELADGEKRALLSLPPNRDPRVRALARQWVAETPDPERLTNRFLDWMRRDFKYTLAAPPLGYNATDEFLFSTRLGFCQHFSSAYVVFMRAAGVPARIVTGYVGGRYNNIGDYWRINRKDAHAWAEVWIEGHGWKRVDPTAAIAPENILDTVDDLQAQQEQGGIAGLAGSMLEPMFDSGDFLRRQWNELVLGFDSARQKGLLKPFGIEEADNWQLVLAFAIGAVIALAITLLLLLRQHRDRSDPLVRAWRKLVRRLARTGLRKHESEPPLTFVERAGRERPALADRLLALGRRYSDWRYAGHRLEAAEKTQLIRDLRDFRA